MTYISMPNLLHHPTYQFRKEQSKINISNTTIDIFTTKLPPTIKFKPISYHIIYLLPNSP